MNFQIQKIYCFSANLMNFKFYILLLFFFISPTATERNENLNLRISYIIDWQTRVIKLKLDTCCCLVNKISKLEILSSSFGTKIAIKFLPLQKNNSKLNLYGLLMEVLRITALRFEIKLFISIRTKELVWRFLLR